MIVKICIGSSCHLKGSYDVVQGMREMLRKYDVEDLVELQASFCFGQCADGVVMRAEESLDGSEDVFISSSARCIPNWDFLLLKSDVTT